jgi:hypothetical protein
MTVDLFRGLQGKGEGGAGIANGGWRATRTWDGGGGRKQFAMVVTGLRDREGRPNPPREECRGEGRVTEIAAIVVIAVRAAGDRGRWGKSRWLEGSHGRKG